MSKGPGEGAAMATATDTAYMIENTPRALSTGPPDQIRSNDLTLSIVQSLVGQLFININQSGALTITRKPYFPLLFKNFYAFRDANDFYALFHSPR